MTTLKELYGDIISKSAFKVVDGQMRIIGKWCELEIVGDKLDIMLIGNDRKPLTERKITNLERKLPTNWHFHRLNGEAYTLVPLKTKLQQHLKLLGIRARKRISEETRQKLTDHLRELRRRQS